MCRCETGVGDACGERRVCGGCVGRILSHEADDGRHQRAVQVLVAPHHTLGHPRGAARIEDVELVAGPLDALERLVRGDQLFVAKRAVDEIRAVVDLHHGPQLWQPLTHLRDMLAQRPVEHEHLGIGVVEQIRELLLEVPVVHVDVSGAQLERRGRRLEILVAVVEIQRDLRVDAEAERSERAGETGGPFVERTPGHPLPAVGEREPLGLGVGDRLPTRGQVPTGHAHPPECRR
jgi:hypothetical protein